MPTEPTPPSNVANYVVEGVQRQDADALRALSEYCLELAEHKTRPVDEEEVDGDVVDVDREEIADELDADELDAMTGFCVVKKNIDCGPGCKKCPHGPYLYANYRDGSGDVKTKYLGPA